MLLVRRSKYVTNLLFCNKDIDFVVWWYCFLKRRLLDDKNDLLLKSKNLHILKGVNPCFWSEVPTIFRAFFSVTKTLILSFDDVVFSTGGFLDDKNDLLLQSKNFHILKGVNPCFWSEVLTIFRAYFSVTKTLILSFDEVVFSTGGFLDDKNDLLLKSKNLHILKGVNACFCSEVPNIFRAYFSVAKTLILSFDDVVFSKGGFLDYKNDILL